MVTCRNLHVMDLVTVIVSFETQPGTGGNLFQTSNTIQNAQLST